MDTVWKTEESWYIKQMLEMNGAFDLYIVFLL